MWVKLRDGINGHESIDFCQEAPNDTRQEPSISPLQVLQKRKSVGENCGLSIHTETFSSFNAFEFQSQLKVWLKRLLGTSFLEATEVTSAGSGSDPFGVSEKKLWKLFCIGTQRHLCSILLRQTSTLLLSQRLIVCSWLHFSIVELFSNFPAEPAVAALPTCRSYWCQNEYCSCQD